ncbi:MAG: GNAT family N-acetyltransferase [Phycisphaeraceae bacterium]|nr:MAG: GNAT family N-acetyltransferase [Phycisphaeraceae bacterium]
MEREARAGGEIEVRPATAGDVPSILPMVRALCDLHASNDPERFAVRDDVIERYAAWLPERAADPRSVLLLAEAGGRPAGFLVGTVEPEVPIFWVPECGWVHDVWVEPWARGRGAARRLVRGAASRFTAMGVKQMRLHTGVFNDAARAVFAAEGFRPCVVEMLKGLG